MVERAAAPRVSAFRRHAVRLARAATTPLLPDDYLALMNPAWSARELSGAIVRVTPETDDVCTVVVKPDFAWPGHRPGQYLRIGAELNGIRHWRAYSLTSDPDHPEGLVSITVKRVPEGLMSPWFTQRTQTGRRVFLGAVEGEFHLPDPLPARMLFISAGSGITPIWSMLRELQRAEGLVDVRHIHCARDPDDVIFGERLRDLAAQYPGYRLHEHLDSQVKRLEVSDLDDLCPDWRERATFLSGPPDMLDAMEAHWASQGDQSLLHTERFQPIIGRGDAQIGSGGTVRFRIADFEATCEVGVSILVGGERAGAVLPYGCRMGICHTCVGRLCSGRVRDLRTGEVSGDAGQTIRTCVNAPEGAIEIEL